MPLTSIASYPLLVSLPSWVINTPSILLMIFGFGFVVFFHELGHFLAAKVMGIKVEQFAVGMGQAIVSYRRGLGFRRGSSRKEYDAALAAAAAEGTEGKATTGPSKHLGETEYRINWLPLGGYVKMLGQDDLRPGAEADDPRAYNNKSVGARMIVVSAGVIMNIILAALLFMLLFRVLGFSAPPTIAGPVAIGSPAEKAGIQPGDQLMKLGSHDLHDFTELMLYAALLHEGESVPVELRRPRGDGTYEQKTVMILPQRMADQPTSFLAIGVPATSDLQAPSAEDMEAAFKNVAVPDDLKLLKPGERIVAINGKPVALDEYYKLNQALQASGGNPVSLTVAPPPPSVAKSQENAAPATQEAGRPTRVVEVQPHFQSFDNANGSFIDSPFNLSGLAPRLRIGEVSQDLPAGGKLMPQDVLCSMKISAWKDPPAINPQFRDVQRLTNLAGNNGQTLDVMVLRDGNPVTITQLAPTKQNGAYLLGISLSDADEQHAVISRVLPETGAARAKLISPASAPSKIAANSPSNVPATGESAVGAAVASTSPANSTGIPEGATILSIDAVPVHNWFDVRNLLSKGIQHDVKVQRADSTQTQEYQMDLDEADVAELNELRYATALPLDELRQPRKTSSTLVAAGWGVTETRDFVLQFYVTIKRMIQGSVPFNNVMGPLGMFQAGAKFAEKGLDWLTWFLAIISANLAVVNFLPIPIVDGGLFTFLIIEKVRGRPLSSRTQAIAQVVGLVLIVSVFLLVTYQDIARNFHH